MKDTYGGRRFLLASASGLVATVLQWFGKLDPSGNSYMLIIVGTVAAYITGNVAERRNINKYPPGLNDDAKDRT